MYKTGNIPTFWTDHYKNVTYCRKPYSDPTEILYWESIGFSNNFFTGEMAIIEKNEALWANDFFNLFPGKNIGLTLYKMTPGVIMPGHTDKFSLYKKLFNINANEKIFRAIIFLEDWQSGHIFEVENTLLPTWKSGDYVLWDENTPHMAANLGTTPRYTAQITFTDV
jgi:hypothetical protein